jgi:hypothetical protein
MKSPHLRCFAAVTFEDAVGYRAGTGTHAVAIGDLNGDHWADIVVANQGTVRGLGGSISVLLNNGDGTFRRGLNYDRGGVFISLVLGDFNRDGRLDVAAINAKSNSVDVLLGNGDGTFGTATSYPGDPGEAVRFVAAGELSPGAVDLVVAESCNAFPCQASALGVLLGNGDGTFQSMVDYTTEAKNTHSPIITDVNNDGKLDVVAGTDSGIVTFAGKGDGTLGAGLFQSAKLHYGSLAAGEFNSDSIADVAVVGLAQFVSSLGVLLGKGNGRFSSQTVGVLRHSLLVTSADLDGDTKDDLVVKAQDNNVYVCFGNGDATFQEPQIYNVHSPRGTVAIGDVNHDRLPDIVTADGNSGVQVLLNAGP